MGSHVGGLWSWWCHQMETFSVLLTLCEGNSSVTGEFPSQRPVTQSFDVFFDLHLNKWLSKQSRHWWFDMPSPSLWRHCNEYLNMALSWGDRSFIRDLNGPRKKSYTMWKILFLNMFSWSMRQWMKARNTSQHRCRLTRTESHNLHQD